MDKAHWLEVSLTVDGELAEAVADVMARYVKNGVVVESGVIYANTEDEGTAFGPVRVYGFLLVSPDLEEQRQKLVEALWHLGQIQPLPEPAFRVIDDEDWMASWKQHYRPIPIGERLLVLPAWVESSDPRRVAVKIDPSMAFGTGTHPTTQLCMAMIEKYLTPGQQVMDVGCGSGILSIAAIKLGAGHTLAVDIDDESTRATLENAERNEVRTGLEIGKGSVAEIRAGQFSLRAAPLVLANILAPIILRLFDDGLGDLVEPGGILVLSGILDEQAAAVQARAEAEGYTHVETAQMGDWVAIVLRR